MYHIPGPVYLMTESLDFLTPFPQCSTPPKPPLATTRSILCSCELFCFFSSRSHIDVSSYRVRLHMVPLSLVPCRLTCVVANEGCLLFALSNGPLCVHTTPPVSTHLAMGTWVASTSWCGDDPAGSMGCPVPRLTLNYRTSSRTLLR